MNESREQLEAMLSAYLDGELAPARHADVEAWLARDPHARALLADLQVMRDALHALPRARASGDMMEAVRSRMERQALLGDVSAASQQARGGLPAAARWAAAASIALMVCAGGYLTWTWNARQLETIGEHTVALDSPTDELHTPLASAARTEQPPKPGAAGLHLQDTPEENVLYSYGDKAVRARRTWDDSSASETSADREDTMVVTLAFADPQSKRRAVEQIYAGDMIVTNLQDADATAGTARRAARLRGDTANEHRGRAPAAAPAPPTEYWSWFAGRESSSSAPAHLDRPADMHGEPELLELLVLVPDEQTRDALVERFRQPENTLHFGAQRVRGLDQQERQAGLSNLSAATGPALPEDSIVFARPRRESRISPSAKATETQRVQPNAPATLEEGCVTAGDMSMGRFAVGDAAIDADGATERIKPLYSSSQPTDEMASARADAVSGEHLLKLHIRVQPSARQPAMADARLGTTLPTSAPAEPVELNPSVLDLTRPPTTASAPE